MVCVGNDRRHACGFNRDSIVPITIPQVISGEAGRGLIQRYSSPEFVYKGLIDIEDLFAKTLKTHFDNFKADQEISEAPKIIPAYSAVDRQFHCIIVEASVIQIQSQGLNLNRHDTEFIVNPADTGSTEAYEVVEADVSYNVDLYCRSPNRKAVIFISDWVMAGLFGSLQPIFKQAGIVIQANSMRFSGKPEALREGPDAKNLTWAITVTISNIILPWARMYKKDLPSIQDIRIQTTV